MTSAYRDRREDERDVDVASLADHLLDGADSLRGGGDLDHQVRQVDALVQATGRLDRPGGVVGQARGHFERDEAVGAAAAVVDRTQHRAGVGHVVDDQLPVRLLDGQLVGERLELLVVVGGSGDGLLEDGRVRGHPPDPESDQLVEPSGREVRALEVVDPGALSLLFEQLVQTGSWSFVLLDHIE